jgi:predicted DCC family thiol-disulfide oxidoreductase YuxK
VTSAQGPELLLWDGTCGFCRRSVDAVLRKDTGHAFLALPYQEAPSPPMTPALRAACARSFHVVRADGGVLRAGRAALYVLARLGHPVLARVLALPPLVWAVELGYWLVARNRQLFSKYLFRRT